MSNQWSKVRVMKSKFMVLTLTAGLLAVSLNIVQAEEQTARPEPAAAQASNEESVTLGDLHTFDVHDFDGRNFSTERSSVPPEIGEFVRTAIQSNQVLRYSAPGEGMLRFRCEGLYGVGCGRIRAEVTVGQDGPVVWSTVRTYDRFLSVSEPNPRKFAREVVGQLSEDYRKAMKAVPLKIQIGE